MTRWWPAAAEMDAEQALREEFPAWQISPGLAGLVWSAFWRTADGRQRRYVAAGSAPELLAKLRAACSGDGHQDTNSTAGMSR